MRKTFSSQLEEKLACIAQLKDHNENLEKEIGEKEALNEKLQREQKERLKEETSINEQV